MNLRSCKTKASASLSRGSIQVPGHLAFSFIKIHARGPNNDLRLARKTFAHTPPIDLVVAGLFRSGLSQVSLFESGLHF